MRTNGEYWIELRHKAGEEKAFAVLRVFAASSKYARLRSYRGDLHMHTHHSDGRKSPLFMAVTARSCGMDFAAITDHNKYLPSLEAIRQARNIGLEMLLFPGEEIEIAGKGHLLSINASDSISEFINNRGRYEPAYQKNLKKIRTRRLATGLSPQLYAHAITIAGKIRKLGGLSSINHPYWISVDYFNLYRPLFEQILRDRLTDCVELMNGLVAPEQNILSLLHYQQAGAPLPVIANTDAHFSESLGSHWTIAFAPDRKPKDILSAIKSGETVACEKKPGGELRIYGSFERAELAYFLEREFFPLHDSLCAAEAKLVRQQAKGKSVANSTLKSLRLVYKELYRKYWA